MFAKNTVDSVLSSFTKMIEQLKDIEHKNLIKVDEEVNKIIAAASARDSFSDEAARAVAVRNKIEGLVS